ncbi:MAG: hypothetical protein ACRDBY_14190 [Cetobacterium sp.]
MFLVKNDILGVVRVEEKGTIQYFNVVDVLTNLGFKDIEYTLKNNGINPKRFLRIEEEHLGSSIDMLTMEQVIRLVLVSNKRDCKSFRTMVGQYLVEMQLNGHSEAFKYIKTVFTFNTVLDIDVPIVNRLFTLNNNSTKAISEFADNIRIIVDKINTICEDDEREKEQLYHFINKIIDKNIARKFDMTSTIKNIHLFLNCL